jgi:hypothetical protein
MNDRQSAATKKVEIKVSIGALVVSAIAVFLSQIPPLHELLEKPELRFAVTPNVEIGHTLGHVTFTRYVTLSNTGKKAGTVVRTQMFVARLGSGDFQTVYPAASVSLQAPQFFANAGSVAVPWHPITIAANQDWSSYVSYTQPWTVDEERASGALVQEAAHELPQSAQEALQSHAQISVDTFTKLNQLVNHNLLGFGTGRYGILTYFWDAKSPTAKIDKCDIIEVSDLHMQTLQDNVSRYRSGFGLVYSNGGPIPTSLVDAIDCDSQTALRLKARFAAGKS